MADDSDRGRRYSEHEVALIIRRAAELQRDEVEPNRTDSAGLSLAQLEQVAREAGLDPALVRRAAVDLDTRTTAVEPSPVLGAARTLRLERTIRGELPEEEYETLIEAIRRAYADNGYVSVLGRTLAWSSSPAGHRRAHGRAINVSVQVRAGRTTIRIEESLRTLAGGIFGGIMGGLGGGGSGIALGVGLGALGSPLIAAGLIAGFVGGSYLIARGVFGSKAEDRGREMQSLMEQLADHVSAAAVLPDTPGTAFGHD